MTDPLPGRLYRFGSFEADRTTGELRRNGVRIKLNSQPFQVLVMLLERPGELLTREEISRELWPNGTFVDYEHGVNSAINRLREALRDTASSPRFVETRARRGYRFVAPVERIELNNTPSAPESDSPLSVSQDQITYLAQGTRVPAEPETTIYSRILSTPEELPKASYPVVQTLFVLMQFMYVGFYVGALANLAEIEDLFSPLPKAAHVLNILIVTAAILIPVRAFVLANAFFHAPRARENFLKIWPFFSPSTSCGRSRRSCSCTTLTSVSPLHARRFLSIHPLRSAHWS